MRPSRIQARSKISLARKILEQGVPLPLRQMEAGEQFSFQREYSPTALHGIALEPRSFSRVHGGVVMGRRVVVVCS